MIGATMQTRANAPTRVPVTGTQAAPKQTGKSLKKIEIFGLRALWLHFADEMDLRRLAILHLRIRRKEHALHVLKEEQRQIRRKCTRRMQRARSSS
ncbi:hypothetical protein Q4598_04090 [Phaeobacter inhibens]|uniref:hypothetical protein n=1 Tax=Phaeobacter inhibens TaxID=221822 RepID=UPI0026E48817|nr:hypothetical protein [Phaeobacter inhibens]MDO6755400.1 hypothetical protein [Phaeobacter inhibens]